MNSYNYCCKLTHLPTKNAVGACAFVYLTQYFSKKYLLQLVLWNKLAPLKEQG